MKIVLIVEDDLEIRKVYQDKLTAENFEVLLAIDAAQALTILAKETPDLVILDVILPGGKNGFDILSEIRRQPKFANLPVLVLTNLDSQEATAKELGANDCLIKANISLEDLVARVKALIK